MYKKGMRHLKRTVTVTVIQVNYHPCNLKNRT